MITLEFGSGGYKHQGNQNHSPIYWAIYIFTEMIRLGSKMEATAFHWNELSETKRCECDSYMRIGLQKFVPQKQLISKDKNTLPMEYRDAINCIEEACKKIGIVFSCIFYYEGYTVDVGKCWSESSFFSSRMKYFCQYKHVYAYSCKFRFRCGDFSKSKELLYAYINEIGKRFMDKVAASDILLEILDKMPGHFESSFSLSNDGFYSCENLYDDYKNKNILSFSSLGLKVLSDDSQIIGLFLAMNKNYNKPFQISVETDKVYVGEVWKTIDIFHFHVGSEYHIPQPKNSPKQREWY